MIWTIFLLLFILFLFHQFYWRLKNLPKGPLPLPLIGNMHQMIGLDKLFIFQLKISIFTILNRFEYKFLEWREKYGPIYTLWFGTMPVVTVNSYKEAYELFVKEGDLFVDRHAMENLLKKTRGGVYGLIETNGELWREQRRFALQTLRNFGLGKNKMQEQILEEFQTICEKINKEIDKGVNEHEFHKYTDLAAGSIINSIVNGYKFSVEDNKKEFLEMKQTTEAILNSFTDPLLILGLMNDKIANFPVIKGRFDRIVGLYNKIFAFLDNIIDEHLENNDYGEEFEPRDFIDAYLMEMNRREKSGEIHYFSRPQLKATALDLWIGGQETTSATISWGIAYLICHPEVQSKLHEELDKIIGSDRMITLSDKTQLHYTQAVIMEIQRCCNLFTSNVWRKASKDIEINGILIKKGTVIVPQISTIMVDPNDFPNPQKFDPSRFIDSNSQFKSHEHVIPFSIGKRACMGESMARMELFLFIANLFNQYKFLPGKSLPTLKKVKGTVSINIESYKCQVERRF